MSDGQEYRAKLLRKNGVYPVAALGLLREQPPAMNTVGVTVSLRVSEVHRNSRTVHEPVLFASYTRGERKDSLHLTVAKRSKLLFSPFEGVNLFRWCGADVPAVTPTLSKPLRQCYSSVAVGESLSRPWSFVTASSLSEVTALAAVIASRSSATSSVASSALEAFSPQPAASGVE